MKLMAFVKSLLPRIDKSDILEDINVTKTEITTGIIPTYESARVGLKTLKIKSKDNLELQKVFYRNYDISANKKQENMVADIAEALPTLLVNLEYVESQLDDILSKDIIRDGLSARKVTLIRAADHISFISRMSIDLLNLVYVNEAEARHSNLEDGYKLVKKTRELIEKNVFVFGKLLKAYTQDPKNFQVLVGSMPDIVINSETEELLKGVYAEHDLDPLSSDLVQNFEYNPIYHIRLAIAEWQANRYKKFADTKKMLELRLLHLTMMQDDKPSEALKKEIEYIQKRVDDIDYKLKKMED